MSNKKAASFELRNGSVDTLFFAPKASDFEAIRTELMRRFETTPEFFANDGVVIDVRRCDVLEPLSLTALIDLLKQVRMRPIGVIADEAQREWAELGKLPILDGRDKRGAKPIEKSASADAAVAANMVTLQPELAASTMVLDKPLRSGQQIYAKGDLVVLEPVNGGAEVMAEGNLYIYAPLRGRALAGVHGKSDARIFCTCLEAELISIAGIYCTAEAPVAANVYGKSAQIKLVEEKLIIESLRLT